MICQREILPRTKRKKILLQAAMIHEYRHTKTRFFSFSSVFSRSLWHHSAQFDYKREDGKEWKCAMGKKSRREKEVIHWWCWSAHANNGWK